MVESLRERSGLANKHALGFVKKNNREDEYVEFVAKEISKHRKLTPEEHESLAKRHPELHSLAERIRKGLGITGETPKERLASIFGVLHGMVEHQRGKYAEVPERPPAVVPRIAEVRPPAIRPELEAECEKIAISSGEVFDIGDIEGIRIGDDIVITLPKGKDVYLITKGRGMIASSVKKLKDIV